MKQAAWVCMRSCSLSPLDFVLSLLKTALCFVNPCAAVALLAPQVSEIYRKELRSCSPYPGKSVGPESSSRLQLLELSMYLENYLWPNFCPNRSTTEHMMSAVGDRGPLQFLISLPCFLFY